MIDPLMAFAALKTASSTISSAVKAGKDLASLVGPITRLAKAEADLSFAAETKGGILGKLVWMVYLIQIGMDGIFGLLVNEC